MKREEMKVLASNQKVLTEKYPHIWSALQTYMKNKDEQLETEPFKVELVQSREDADALSVYKENVCIRLNSRYYPMREAKQWAAQYEYHHISAHVVMYGMGNGIFARELLKNLEADNSFIIIEPDFRLFSQIIGLIDISDIIQYEKVTLFFYHIQQEEIKDILSSMITWGSISTLIRCNHPGYDKLDLEKYEEYNTMVDRLYEKAQVSQNTYALFADSVIHNVINSLQYIKKSNYITEFIGQFPEDYPAVVVSAGPSLRKNVEKLRKMKDRAFVLVVDTAVKVMEESGVPYDAIVLIDPTKPADFITAYPGAKEKPLFCLTESQTDIMDFHQGRKIWLPNAKWLEKTYAQYGLKFPTHVLGGSVATMATEVARIVGCKTIILVGQDLAYLGEQTHAGREDAMGEERGYESQWIDGIDGKQVRSRWDWIHYLHWFEEFISKNTELNVVDATEGGALIHGSKVMTLEEAADEYCKETFSFDDFLNQLPYTFEQNDFRGIKEEIYKLKTDSEQTVKMAECALEYLQEFYHLEKDSSPEILNGLLAKCFHINTKFARVSGYELIEIGTSGAVEEALADVNHLSGDEAQDRRDTVKMLEVYYKSVIDVTRRIIKEMDQVFVKMEQED